MFSQNFILRGSTRPKKTNINKQTHRNSIMGINKKHYKGIHHYTITPYYTHIPLPGPLLQHLPSLGPRRLPRGAPAAAGAHGGATGAGGGAARRGAAAHGLGAAERRDELGGATATGGRFGTSKNGQFWQSKGGNGKSYMNGGFKLK
jgi:hypothetical protein